VSLSFTKTEVRELVRLLMKLNDTMLAHVEPAAAEATE
jgi:hypothetical protein